MVCKPGDLTCEVVCDNCQIVSYNLYLLQKFWSYINVKVCAIIQAIKYVHKYVYKGLDHITVAVLAINDEITCYVQGQYVGPIEGFWCLFEFLSYQEQPLVCKLAVHLPNQHIVYFADDLTSSEAAAKAANAYLTLIAFFQYNQEHADSCQYLYQQFLEQYTQHQKTMTQSLRKRGYDISCMYHYSPISGKQYYLRLLLTVVCSLWSFADLLEFNSISYPTYQAACIARRLADNDQEWIQCFDEAILFTLAYSLQTLFLTGLCNQEIRDLQAI